MAAEHQGFMVDGVGSSHEAATVVATVEASGAHPVALHPTEVVGCGAPPPLDSIQDSKAMAYLRWHEESLGV